MACTLMIEALCYYIVCLTRAQSALLLLSTMKEILLFLVLEMQRNSLIVLLSLIQGAQTILSNKLKRNMCPGMPSQPASTWSHRETLLCPKHKLSGFLFWMAPRTGCMGRHTRAHV